MTDREKLRKLAEAATPGPWDYYRPHPNYRAYAVDRVMPGGHLGEDVATTGDVYAEENGAYIAAANPTAVLDLLDQLDAAEAKLAAVRARRDDEVAACVVPCMTQDGALSCASWPRRRSSMTVSWSLPAGSSPPARCARSAVFRTARNPCPSAYGPAQGAAPGWTGTSTPL